MRREEIVDAFHDPLECNGLKAIPAFGEDGYFTPDGLRDRRMDLLLDYCEQVPVGYTKIKSGVAVHIVRFTPPGKTRYMVFITSDGVYVLEYDKGHVDCATRYTYNGRTAHMREHRALLGLICDSLDIPTAAELTTDSKVLFKF